MDVRCERCRAQYVFDDEQVTPSGLTVQCTNCGHVFKVKKKELVVTVAVKPDEVEGVPLPATAAAPRAATAGQPVPAPEAERPHEPPREWRVRQANGNIFTFRELTTLQKWIIEQKVGRDDEISLSGDSWKRLGNIAELASFFQVVEAAERSRTQSAMPAVTPLPMPAVPVYGVVQAPIYQAAPPPPAGYPAPGYPPPAPPPPPTTTGEYRVTRSTPILPPPVHEVDLGPDVSAAGKKPPARGRLWTLVVLLLGALGAAGYVYGPKLFPPPPPPPRAVAVPITIEVKPEPPAPALPAPEPEVEPAPPPPPEPVKPKAPRGPKALLAQAARLLERGDVEAALELYGSVASEDPENVEALTGRGLCYLDLENYPPAEASFSAALQVSPGYADALLGLAETYRYQGKKSEAISHYEKYLARHPDGEDAEVARNALSELR